MKDEVATLQHALGETAHDRLGLDMKVTEHLVGVPAAD
jgi:hypothetical protein